jgi:hypothetical protein
MNDNAPQESARLAPSRYETQLRGLFRGETPARRPFLPRPLSWIAAVSVMTWVLVVAAAPLPSSIRVPAALALCATFLAGGFAWLRTWSVVAERTHVRLLARPDLGDLRRFALFFGAFIGYGLASVAIGGAVLSLLGGRDR